MSQRKLVQSVGTDLWRRTERPPWQ